MRNWFNEEFILIEQFLDFQSNKGYRASSRRLR